MTNLDAAIDATAHRDNRSTAMRTLPRFKAWVAALTATGGLTALLTGIAPPAAAYYDRDEVAASTTGAAITGYMLWNTPVAVSFVIRISDTANDGQCANLYIRGSSWPGWQYVNHACGVGTSNTVNTSWNLGGAGAGRLTFRVCRHQSMNCATDVNSYGGD